MGATRAGPVQRRPWAWLALSLALCAAIAGGCEGKFLTAEQIDQRLDAAGTAADGADVAGLEGDADSQADTLAAADSDGAGSSDSAGETASGCVSAADCSDGNPCTTDACPASGTCEHTAIADGGTCDDGNACTAGEFCAAGKCGGGTVKHCDDNNVCTADACLPAKGCTHTDDDGATCDDADPCTVGDKCLAGQCQAQPKDCGNDACTTAKCVNGVCKSASKVDGLDCDDKDGCTSGDKCQDGLCVGAQKTLCDDKNPCSIDSCVGTLGCQFALVDGPCSDGDACTLGDTCAGGTCAAGATKACDDGNPCTQDLCQPVDGSCAVTPTAGPCSDGNACTTGDGCAAGACSAGKLAGCDDNNPCTVDSCDANSGSCTALFNTAGCEDGDACTVGDSCSGGECKAGAVKPCADSDTCTSDACDAKTGACQHSKINGCGEFCASVADCKAGNVCNQVACLSGKCAFLPTTAICDDGDACTLADQCGAGACQPGSPKNCDDGKPCTTDSCQAGTCNHANNSDPCSDNNACTQGDLCKGGACGSGKAKACDDGNPCTSDSCDVSSGDCQATANSEACDDKNPCTSTDSCQLGQCAAGTPVNCDDGNLCTHDSCDGKTGTCVHANNSAPCSDGNACSEGDVCAQGSCASGAAKVCQDGNACTNDACDPLSAACLYTPNAAPCSDGDACTIGDSCAASGCKAGAAKVCADSDTCTNDTCDSASGNCVYKPITGCGGNCTKPSDCGDANPCTDDSCVSGKCAFPANTAACSDGNACTVSDLCSGGTCKAGATKACSDGNPCTADACDNKSGDCGHTPNVAGCDDGNACTAGDVCGGGACKAGKATDCSDGNPCTDDACDPTSGNCKSSSNTATCTDGNACTSGDVCAGGTCKPGAAKGCDDGNPCTNDACDPLSGVCSKVANSAQCSDANDCTQGDLCSAGVCKPGAAKACDDKNVCTQDSCDAASGACVAAPNAAPCDDGSKCTQADKCTAGSCQPGTAKVCDDGQACTIDSCSPGDGSCVFAPKIGCGGNCNTASDCSDGNGCTDDQCAAGKCAFPNNTASCTDNNPCTLQDACSGGTCKAGSAKTCDDSNPCTNDSCNATTGLCNYVGNTAGCSDSDACTAPDLCANSNCTPGAKKTCTDNNPCTNDSCNPATGACVNANNSAVCNDNNACTSGDICSGGSCAGPVTVGCDDGKLCTTDSCDPAGGCKTVNNSSPCNDNNLCTTGDTCSGGGCVGGSAPVCNDNNACTTDSCAAAIGCKFDANTNACEDGNKCTLNDVCSAGTCSAGSGKTCTDSDTCTTDSCDPASGSCVYKPIIGCGGYCDSSANCNDGNLCTDDACVAGKCTNTANTANCTDNDACTTGDKCSGAACKPTGTLTCSDGNVCTSDSCVKATGCSFVNNSASCTDNNACTTGDLCSGGACLGGAPPSCEDNNGCTTDSCDKGKGCQNLANNAPCDDGDACTANEQCAKGNCVATTDVLCTDNNACTNDSCDKAQGCVFTNVSNGAGCDDGKPCSLGDSCLAGQCKAGVAVWVDRLAGSVPAPNSGAGGGSYAEGTGEKAAFNTPMGIAFHPGVNVLVVADTYNHLIRKVTLQGKVSDIAGVAGKGSYADGQGSNAAFNLPMGVAVRPDGQILVADTGNHLIRAVMIDGTVTTVAGTGSGGSQDGSVKSATFVGPRGVAVSVGGVAAIADTGNHMIRLIKLSEGLVVTLAGSPSAGFKDGMGSAAQFNTPVGVAFDTAGRLYVADQSNHRIRQVLPSGQVLTVAGDGTAGMADSTNPLLAKFNFPAGVLVAPTGLFVADSFNGRIRRGAANGVATLAGSGTGAVDGLAASATFYLPQSLAADSGGYLYVADVYNHLIRRVRDSSGGCTINGQCVVGGWWKPGASCYRCEAASSATAWTGKPNGAPCDDGLLCTAEDLCNYKSGPVACNGTVVTCNDGNACTNDSCSAATGACQNLAGSGACDDGSPCTYPDTCSGGSCGAGTQNGCADGNPCTEDLCNKTANTCENPPVSYGISCTAMGKEGSAFCAGTKCTSLEQSANIVITGGATLSRLTSVDRGPDKELYVSGFGANPLMAGGLSAIYKVATASSPPSVALSYSGSHEIWTVVRRLASGGFGTVGGTADSAALLWGLSNGTWAPTAGPGSLGSRSLREASVYLASDGSENYLFGGATDTGGNPTSLYRARWTGSGWSTASGSGEMALFNSAPANAGECATKRIGAPIAGLATYSATEGYVASNWGSAAPLAQVALWDANSTVSTTCATYAPGGSVFYGTGANYLGVQGTATAVAATSASRALLVGTQGTAPFIYRRTANGWTAESPAPLPPSGLPAWNAGNYAPSSVWLGASDAWVVGTLKFSGCAYVFALHASMGATTAVWDKLLVTTNTVVGCSASASSHVSATKVWGDPTDGAIYITGSAPTDSTGKTWVNSGGSMGQVGILWRIK